MHCSYMIITDMMTLVFGKKIRKGEARELHPALLASGIESICSVSGYLEPKYLLKIKH